MLSFFKNYVVSNVLICIGVGKTTIIQKVCTALKDNNISVQGFYTEEVRIGGRRTGFDVVTLNGNRGQLARVGYERCFKYISFLF